LLLLYALARELRSLRVLLVATCRDVEARLDAEASEIISRLGREGSILGLSRLDRATVEHLLRQRAGLLAPEVEARIFDSTQGNPLFVDEMLRLLDEEGPMSIAAGVVPAGVRDVIRQRLDRVAPDARGLLDLAAVAGDEVQPALLAAAAGRDPGFITTRVVEAIRAGVFAERGGKTRFSHALVREVLYRDLDPDVRRAHHAAVGRALERTPTPDGLPLMELAHHALEGPPEDLARAVDFSVRAAGRAVELTAPVDAIAVLMRARARVESAGNPAPLLARVLLALGEMHIRNGDVVTGTSLCCEVATLARTLGDPELLARAALTYGRVFKFAAVDPVMVDLFEEALAAQPPGDSPLRARLLARLAGALQPSDTPEEPVRLAHEAIAIARRLGDRRALLETIHDGLVALMDIVDPRERLPLNLEARSLAVLEGDRERLLRTHARLALDYLSLGEFARADEQIDAFEELATELRASWILWRVPLFRAVRATTHGRFDEAERLEAQARDLARSTHDPQTERALILFREGLLRTAERHDEMRALEPLARRERSHFNNPLTFQGIGSALMYTRLEDAENAKLALDLVPDVQRPPIDNLFALFFLAESASYVGSAELAARLFDRLTSWADQYVMLGMTQVQWEGPVARLLALLAARVGRWDQAIGYFEDAVARLVRLDARPHLARAQYEFGRALLQRGRPEDAARAYDLIAAGRAIAVELGMSGLVAHADTRLATRPDRPARTVDAADLLPAVGALFAMTLEGEYWTFILRAGTTFRLKDSLGLQYVARLVAEPGREFHVLDLVSGGRGGADSAPVDAGDAGELLDDEARAEYRRRLEDLRDSLAEAESFGDATRAARAREEIDFLGAELGRAVGLGGRARRAGSAAERARSAVQRRIKNAIVRIGEAAPNLAPLLARTVRTGNFCSYRPDPG
jgi:tetratricopeptide (TPR) repeat protein